MFGFGPQVRSVTFQRLSGLKMPRSLGPLGDAWVEDTLASFKALRARGSCEPQMRDQPYVDCGRLPERESHATLKDFDPHSRPHTMRPVLRRDALAVSA